MAFIDTTASVGAQYGGVSAAPTGGGVASNAPMVQGSPGSSGLGSGLAAKHWVFIFYAIIIGTLVVTGVIFNGKGRK